MSTKKTNNEARDEVIVAIAMAMTAPNEEAQTSWAEDAAKVAGEYGIKQSDELRQSSMALADELATISHLPTRESLKHLLKRMREGIDAGHRRRLQILAGALAAGLEDGETEAIIRCAVKPRPSVPAAKPLCRKARICAGI